MPRLRYAYLMEVDGYTDVAASVTERYSMNARRGYRTRPSDAPPNAWYRDVVLSLGLMEQSMFKGGLLSAANAQPSCPVGYGVSVIENIDGAFDAIYGQPGTRNFRERPVRILQVLEKQPYATAVVVQRAVISQPEMTRAQVALNQKDLLYTLDTPHITTTYLGNNALPAGVQGGADLAGKPVPYLRGRQNQIEPKLVNTSKLIWQVCGNGFTSATMYDGGKASFTVGADYVSQADMETTAPAAGEVRFWKAGGMLRTGSKPAGRVTVDAIADTSGNSTAAQLLKSLAISKGYVAGDINAADVTALDAANSAVLGFWIDDTSTTLDIMNRVAASVGAFFWFDRLGVMRMARLQLPPGSAANAPVFARWNVAAVDTVASDEDIPYTKVRLRYNHYLVAQTAAELDSSLTAAVVGDLAQEWRVSEASSTPVPNPYKRVNVLEHDTLFAFKADADAEASRLATLYSLPRRTFLLKDAQLDAATRLSLDLNTLVELRWPRYGFSVDVGTICLVIGFKKDLTRGVADLTIWVP